jgi:nucleotide-binding universal stress UspA family protein
LTSLRRSRRIVDLFTTVLCPIDFSEPSTRALHYAIALAGRERGRVTLIHVAPPLLAEAAAAAYGATFVKDDAERELRTLATASVANVRGGAPQTDVVVRVGDPASEILQCAGDLRAECIVMGTQGLSGLKKMFFGSVTEHVLRRSSTPVLAVPPGEPVASADGLAERIGRVMAPVDFSDRSIDDVRVALALAKGLSVPLLVLHVVAGISGPAPRRDALAAHDQTLLTSADTKMDALVAALGTGQPIETLVTTGSPADQIGAVAAERRVGLIVMGLVATPGLLGAPAGSVAYRVLSLATAPVLALPNTRSSP